LQVLLSRAHRRSSGGAGRTTLLRRFIWVFSDKFGQAVGRIVIALILLVAYALLLTGFTALVVWLQSL
jgi:hypothetical protein